MHQATTMLSSTRQCQDRERNPATAPGVALAQNLLHIYLFSLPNMARARQKLRPVFSCNNSYKLKTWVQYSILSHFCQVFRFYVNLQYHAGREKCPISAFAVGKELEKW